MGILNKKYLEMGHLATTLSLIGSIVVGWIFIDDRYAIAAEETKTHRSIVLRLEQGFVDIQINDKTAVLRKLKAQKSEASSEKAIAQDFLEKKWADSLFSTYDQLYLDSVEGDLDRLYIKKQQLQSLE